MRKVHKEQAEELLRLVGQMHEEIREKLKAGESDMAAGNLGQCQETAIQLGEMIEQSEGEGHVTVRLLEEYCEWIYRLYEKICQSQDIDAQREYQILQDALRRVCESMKKDVRLRKEAVFLPYKAAMWDSLESVWRAADEDPDCDAYVIPIPYFDKRPDGSLGEMHYELERYPDDVPVMRYEEYDFEKRQPDMIFIHNPYDEHNLVTSVHPFFYSKNLKKYTEQLVYIPYFNLNEMDPSNEEAIKRIEDLCVVSAVIYADKVIVQSENMRQIYINLMQKNMNTDKIPRSYWENKILGLGSPKYDRVVAANQRKPEMPKEWKRIVQKPDGTYKKIILYNVSVSSLLQNGELLLDKIKSVFQIFRENVDEIALLWRPHPLIKATIASLRPELRTEYERLVLQYQEEGWGIYDDSPDMDRALVLSDAYYGDGSSLVRLYKRLGKPIMLQNVKCL